MLDFIYSAEPGLVIGFHGCDKSVRDDIVIGKKPMKISNNSFDWLGDGMYFWQNNYERALYYANNPPGQLKIETPAVLGAVFSLGNCLDLTDKKYLDMVRLAYDIYEDSFKSQGKVMPVNSDPTSDPYAKDLVIRRLDCAVIKTVHELVHEIDQTPFDTVRALFPEGDALYTGAGFRESTHIQVAIRNPNMIKGFFVPRRIANWTGLPISLAKTTKSASARKK